MRFTGLQDPGRRTQDTPTTEVRGHDPLASARNPRALRCMHGCMNCNDCTALWDTRYEFKSPSRSPNLETKMAGFVHAIVARTWFSRT